MLLTLTRPSRSADLSQLDIQWRSMGLHFNQPIWQSRVDHRNRDLIFSSHASKMTLGYALKALEERTIEFRLQSSEPKTGLFLS